MRFKKAAKKSEERDNTRRTIEERVSATYFERNQSCILLLVLLLIRARTRTSSICNY